MYTLFKGGGDFGGAGSSRSISDQDQDFEREVKTSIIYLNDLPRDVKYGFISFAPHFEGFFRYMMDG